MFLISYLLLQAASSGKLQKCFVLEMGKLQKLQILEIYPGQSVKCSTKPYYLFV